MRCDSVFSLLKLILVCYGIRDILDVIEKLGLFDIVLSFCFWDE